MELNSSRQEGFSSALELFSCIHPAMEHWSKRLKEAADAMHMTAVDVARAASLPEASVFKYFDGLVNQPRGDAMRRLARVVDKSETWLREGFESPSTIIGDNVRFIPIIGYVEAGVWREAHEIDHDERRDVPISADHPHADKLIVLETRGPSMNRFYPDKTPLYCLKLMDYPFPLKNGLHVVVMRHGNSGTVEMTVKEYEKKDKAIFLHPRSTDPRYQDPLVIPVDEDSQDGVEIYAVVWEALIKAPR